MAQKQKSKQNRRAPAYSADSMAVHLLLGLILIALGLLIFLAVALGMQGDVFAGVRQICGGLAGGLSFLLPVIPIWGGVLVILSTQRRVQTLPFVMASALYLLVLASAVLLSYSGSPAMPLMEYLYQHNRSDAYDLFLARAYEMGVLRGMGGGLLGMLLAWPLWKLIGVIPGVIVAILLAIVCAMAMLRLSPAKIRALIERAGASRREREERQLQEQHEQELKWQREQAMAAQQQAMQYNQGGWYPPQEDPRWAPAPQQQGYDPNQYAPQPPYGQTQPMYQQPAQGYPMQEYPAQEPVQEQPARSPYARPEQPEKKRKPRTPVMQEEAPQETPAPRRRSIFGQSETAAEEEAQVKPRRKGIFSTDEPEEIPEQPVRRSIFARPAEEKPEEPAPQPARRPAAETWEEPAVKQRSASWRTASEEEDAPAYEPRRAAPARAAAKPAPAVAQPEPEPAPEAPKGPQKPKASWADTPPWETDPDAPLMPEEAVTPVLQHQQPKGAWQADLKLKPRREQPMMEKQEEMELPPTYVYPGMNLLKQPEPQTGISPEEDALRSQRLEETLQSFRVPAKVRHITHGPAISRFELELAAGIKVSKVTDLNRNIAMNMEVKSVRIEAPIPGKSLVGVEVPNAKTATVTLREVLESEQMRTDKPLVVALGKDIAGTPVVCDLARMPHLLIAGATGSGKSVCINTIINSLLFRRSPQEVRLILVDPKVVELKCYDGIPHLLIPVVSDPHKASSALGWAVGEMMDRYKKFEHKGVRAIDGYNAALDEGEEFMPRIVIIIDELADLMMVCRKEVEEYICRIAQLARAAGIHLVVATQRPSVDVITGLIKANIPSRIAFKVSSAVDSRTILDKIGAEQLLGYGDMLYQPTGEFTPIRVQGCFMSDAEVNRVTDFIRETCPAEYDADILEQLDQMARESTAAAAPAEPVDLGVSDGNLLMQCIEMAVNDGNVSTSLIQRRLKLGYARAGRLVDEMEKRGIVSAKDGAKPRICLISREEFEQMKASGAIEDV